MTEADQRAAFLRAICEDPKDDTPRLMYADWLDERGEPERAEFIRVQCELAATDDGGDAYWRYQPLEAMPPLYQRRTILRERERELLHPAPGAKGVGLVILPKIAGLSATNSVGNCQPWAPGQYGWDNSSMMEAPLGIVAEFRRGFVAAVTLPADAWHRYGGALCAACPLEEVWIVEGRQRRRMAILAGP